MSALHRQWVNEQADKAKGLEGPSTARIPVNTPVFQTFPAQTDEARRIIAVLGPKKSKE